MKLEDWPFHSQSYWSWSYQQYLDSMAALGAVNFADMMYVMTPLDWFAAFCAVLIVVSVLICIMSSAASLVLKRRVKKMGHWEREGLVDNELAEAVVDKINDLCNRGYLTNRQALARYKQMANVMSINDLKPRGRGWFLHLKDIIQDRRLKADKTPVTIPGPAPLQEIVCNVPVSSKKEPLVRKSKSILA